MPRCINCKQPLLDFAAAWLPEYRIDLPPKSLEEFCRYYCCETGTPDLSGSRYPLVKSGPDGCSHHLSLQRGVQVHGKQGVLPDRPAVPLRLGAGNYLLPPVPLDVAVPVGIGLYRNSPVQQQPDKLPPLLLRYAQIPQPPALRYV